jgi:hypothetical protein
METINLAPKWSAIYPMLAEFVMAGNKVQREYVCSELKRLCEVADKVNGKAVQA